MSLGTQSIGGLASGFDTANIIEQLMRIERRPIQKMEITVKEKELKLDAYRATNNLLSSYYSAIQKAAERATWNTKSATSTNEGALGVQANQYAEPGTYSLRVGRLASAAQYTSAGFANQQTSPVSPTKSGFITIDNGAASLRRSTKLADLNGGAGIYHGSIRISQTGVGTATIDLTTAETIQDVVNAINDTAGINVTARVAQDGHSLELVDHIGGGLTVQNVGMGTTADDLGLTSLVNDGGVHRGTDIRFLTGQTHLAMLRDGQGINGGTLGTIGIKDGAEDEFGVDLSDARNVQDVIRIINETADGVGSSVTASLSDDGRGFKLVGNDTIAVRSDISQGRNRTAEDLGLTVLDASGNGQALLAGMNSVQVATLSGQRQFNRDTTLAQFGLVDGDTFTLQDKDGNAVTYTYTTGDTLGDLLDTLNDPADDAKVLVYIDPDNGRLVIGDTTRKTTGTFTVSGSAAELLGFEDGETAVDDVSGLQGNRIFAGGINGTADDPAANLGKININIGGTNHEIDLTDLGADSNLSDILHRLNAVNPGLRFSLNRSGNGLQVTNSTGQAVTITNVEDEGTTASDLGLARTYATGTTTDAGNLDRKYISGATQLSTLAGGKGVPAGGIVITDSRGRNIAVDLSSAKTIQDVLDRINESGAGVTASINTKGDGILLSDIQGGSIPVEVSELGGGGTAKALGLLGAGRSQLDGSFETRIEVSTSDTLFDIMNKIGNSNADVQASIINDGSAYAPFRLVISSKNTGEAGDILLSSDLDIFNFHKNAEGEDAILLQGRPDSAASPMMLRSSTNTNNSAILGLSFDLKAVTKDFVNISVSEDTSIAFDAINKVVETYNDLQGFVKEFDKWDSEEGKPGLFFGDRAIRNLLDSVTEDFFRVLETPESGLSTWYDIGVKFSREGNVELDTSTLRDALSSNFAAVRNLMTVRNDVARSSYNTSVRTSGAAAPGFSPEGVINGNTNSRDFGDGNGYQSAAAINGSHSLTIDFGRVRTLNGLTIHHIDSELMPANEYALRDFKVEYLDAMTNTWNTLREVNGNRAAITSVGFAEATRVSQVRITATSTNASDKLFRLLEVEGFEADGLASRQSINTKALTDFETGFFAREEREINSQIGDMKKSIDRMEARMEMKESNLVRSFVAMETALSQLSTQGDFFTAQMDALSSNNKK